jgi:hypothetical protein
MDDKEIEDILSDDDDFTPMDLQMDQAEEICGNLTEVKPPAQILNELPKLLGSDFPLEFTNMVNQVLANYRRLPPIDYERIYDELVSLTIKSERTPTVQHINMELQKVQAVKERISEIIRNILPSHTFKRRQVEILKESWIRFSQEKSADKRKADSIYRMSEFESDYLAVDALYKTAMHIAKNLDSTQEILSRRITIVNLELKMNDLGRHSLPDVDFTGPSLVTNSEIGSPVDVDSEDVTDGTPEAEELEF